MKYVFIAGLEHSGTTLTDDLLSRRCAGLGLGEVAGFLSPEHVGRYLERWGRYPDARSCSCGASWTDCPFWSPLRPYWGLEPAPPRERRYAAMISSIRERYGDGVVVVDSSKTLDSLRFLVAHHESIGLSRTELAVILAVRDARGFVASVRSKLGAPRSPLDAVRSYRWWLASNRALLAEVERAGLPWCLSHYEELCRAPDEHVARIIASLALAGDGGDGASDVGATGSHIAIGNKDYVNRSRGTVRYDDRWMHDDWIRLTFHLTPGVRRFNHGLAARASAEAAR